MTEARQPLAGVNVADFSWFAAGPICSEVMALYGATVVRVESETHVDGIRGVWFVRNTSHQPISFRAIPRPSSVPMLIVTSSLPAL